MYKTQYVISANNVIRDAESNLVSVINIIEDLTPESLPAFLPSFWVVACFEKEEADSSILNYEFKVSLDGESILSSNLTSNFLDNPHCRQMVNINTLPILKPGQLLIEFLLPEGRGGTYFITINEPRTKSDLKVKSSSRPSTKRTSLKK